MELIEDDTSVLSESEVRSGPNAGVVRSVLAAGLLLVVVLLGVVLTQPSTEGASPASSGTTESAPATVTTLPTDAAGSADPGVAPTFVLPDRVPLPSQLPVPPPGQKALTLIGQNVTGQVVAFELSGGSVTELDPISGQRFKVRGASANRLAGFRVFLMETMTLGVDGTIRSMPVTEMDLPRVFPTPDGFVVWETTTNALWFVGDDESEVTLPALPDGLAVIAAVEGGLLVQTLDGVTRRYDPATTEIGTPLLGSPVTIGRDRYLTLQCERGPCRTTVRSIGPTPDGNPADTVIVELADDVDVAGDATISPSGGRLAFSGGGAIQVIDLDSGAEIALLEEARNGAFVWAPDDTLFYWLPPERVTVGRPFHEVWLFDLDGHRSAVYIPPEVIDLDQPLHVVQSAS